MEFPLLVNKDKNLKAVEAAVCVAVVEEAELEEMEAAILVRDPYRLVMVVAIIMTRMIVKRLLVI